MKKLILAGIIAAPLFMFATAPSFAQDAAATTCKDGSTSAATGKGACSGHGGVQKAATTPANAGGTAPAPVSSAAPAPASGGGSTCKDGSTSDKTGRGACSGHGGVQKASTSPPAANAGGTAPTPVQSAGSANSSSPAAKSASSGSSASSTPSNSGGTAPTPVQGSSSAPANGGAMMAASNSAGATAKCKDGSYSKSKTHTGTCSKHGGVDQWLDGTK
jgi:hypothetical protein